MISEELHSYGWVHLYYALNINRNNCAQTHKAGVAASIEYTCVWVPAEVVPPGPTYVTLRVQYLFSAFHLVAPLVEHIVNIDEKGCGLGSSFSDLFILYDFVPEDVRFLFSGQPEVLGALGDPRMVVDNDGGGLEAR